MADSLLDSVVLVLYEPQDYVNIAATVRAMKNMGVTQLRLVRPVDYDPWRIQGIAHDTADIVAGIREFESFDEAVADCVRVLAFTARRRAAKFRILDPRAAAADLLEYAPEGPVAIVFGREDSGLPNDVIERVHAAVTIPTTEHVSLNLAQAALLALYELHIAAGDATRRLPPPRKQSPQPTHELFELTYADTETALGRIEFFKTRNAEHIMRSMRAIISRARPDTRELALIRAIFIEVRRYLDRAPAP